MRAVFDTVVDLAVIAVFIGVVALVWLWVAKARVELQTARLTREATGALRDASRLQESRAEELWARSKARSR